MSEQYGNTTAGLLYTCRVRLYLLSSCDKIIAENFTETCGKNVQKLLSKMHENVHIDTNKSQNFCRLASTRHKRGMGKGRG